MSHYGITAIRWNAQHTEVASCMVHQIDKEGNDFVLLDGNPMSFSDVANLVVGEKVWVIVKGDGGEWEKSEPVQVRGQQEYLYSSPGNSLFDLPTF